MIKSEQINELTKALVKAKANFEAVTKSKSNPFFKSKYADLGSVIDATGEALSAAGLAVTQVVTMNDGKDVLLTMLAHESGQFLGGFYALNPAKNDPQGIGSAITYARRYALLAILGIATEDDDGNAASGKPAAPQVAAPAKHPMSK